MTEVNEEITWSAMPPEIAAGIVKVMGEVKKLAKDTRNNFGNFNYASVDQFFEQVGPLMSAAGIFVIVDEPESETAIREVSDERGNVKKSAWMTARYDIYIGHTGGAMFGPIRRTQQVSATGPQSYGSAISYAEKYFLRNLFKIPTGEHDADPHAQEGLPAIKRRSARPPKPPSVAASDDESHVIRDEMIEAIGEFQSTHGLQAWATAKRPTYESLLAEDRKAIDDAYESRIAQLKTKAA